MLLNYFNCGQLQCVTNALGQSTTYNSYDAAGRLLSMTDANGLQTKYRYDLRGRVLSVTQTPPGGLPRVTATTYDFAGQVRSVTTPDGVVMTYTYDAAHQLTSVTDTFSNKVHYSYDLKAPPHPYVDLRTQRHLGAQSRHQRLRG